MLLAATGLVWFSTVEADTGYAEGVMTAMIILGFSMGLIMPNHWSFDGYAGRRPLGTFAAPTTSRRANRLPALTSSRRTR